VIESDPKSVEETLIPIFGIVIVRQWGNPPNRFSRNIEPVRDSVCGA